MKYIKFIVLLALVPFIANISFAQTNSAVTVAQSHTKDASAFGFLPENDGVTNAKALQKAVDGGGTIRVTKAGVYQIAKEILLDDNTNLIFDANVFIKKVAQPDRFSFAFINRGAFERKTNKNIRIEGLHLIVNGVDYKDPRITGLCGQVSFFHVKDLRIERFRCYDVAKAQFCIQVCTFENILINDIVIHGMKDGVHLGRGKRFKVSNAEFMTFDDAVALNAHDYSTSNPELGWIEDGVVENVTDLNQFNTTGFFSRILAGSWTDWKEGMQIRRSDTVASEGRLYRCANAPDGKVYISKTRPTHKDGVKKLDDIVWVMCQNDVVYTAGVRNVVYRDIFLYKPRTAFCLSFENDNYCRSYYPNAQFVKQEGLVFENIYVLHDAKKPFIAVRTPINSMVLKNCSLRQNDINFKSNSEMKDFGKSFIRMYGCTIDAPKDFVFIDNKLENKEVDIYTNGTIIANQTPKVLNKNKNSKIDCDFCSSR